MNENDELEDWRRIWVSQPAVPIDLVRRVERETIYLRLGRIAEVLVTVFIGGGLTVLAFKQPSLGFILLACGTWLFIAYAWRESLASTRGIWTAGAATITSYLDLSIERCRRYIAAVWTMSVLLVLELIFGLIVGSKIVADEGRWSLSSFLTSLSISIAIVLVLLWAGQAYKRRKLQPQLDYLLSLRRQLSDAASDTRR
jgi:hypothetical protein